MRKITLSLILMLGSMAWANTPGHHTVSLTWTNGTTCPTCTANIYRSTTANVCSGTPTPYASVPATTTAGAFTDLNPPTGAVFYNVSNVDPALGGESTCNGEVQTSVLPITTSTPTGLSATTN
jgi:hypothetical protein